MNLTLTCGFVSKLPKLVEKIFKRLSMNKKLKFHAESKISALLSSSFEERIYNAPLNLELAFLANWII